MQHLTPQFAFAGFNWPRYVATLTTGHAALKHKREARKVCGEYYHAPKPNSNDGRGFYLGVGKGGDGQPFTRWEWADDVDPSIRHTGWHADAHGDGETIRGIVVYLPHGRMLAGWSMGPGMASAVDCDLYDDAISAARAADSMAEHVAEDERDRKDEDEG